MKRASKKRIWLAIAAVVAIQVVLAAIFLSQPDRPPQKRGGQQQRASRDDIVEIGGVRRPATDIRPLRQAGRDGDRKPDEQRPENDYGTTPPVPVDLNPNVKSVHEALTTGRFPERVSAMTPPKPFDRAAYTADPQAYLDVVEPGRVWQPAQPGEGVPRIKASTPRYVEAEQGEPVSLRVEAVAGAPVTFTSFDLGAFQNRLTSITVQAGDDGVAVARFTGTPGTINNVNILAASPMTSGQLRFVVNVQLPEAAAQNQ